MSVLIERQTLHTIASLANLKQNVYCILISIDCQCLGPDTAIWNGVRIALIRKHERVISNKSEKVVKLSINMH